MLAYFHGNGEDASYSEQVISQLAFKMQAHSAIMEYPSYGVYKGPSPNEDLICSDALLMFTFLTETLGFKPENVIVVGRSMGSGPATFLASERKIKSLILISPFKSIKTVAKDHFPFWSFLVRERFDNLERIKRVRHPVFILHGQKVILAGYSNRPLAWTRIVQSVSLRPEDRNNAP